MMTLTEANRSRGTDLEKVLTADEIHMIATAVETIINSGSGWGEVRLQFKKHKLKELAVTMTMLAGQNSQGELE